MWVTLLILLGIYLTGLLMLAGAVWRAPEGFEDERGFHEGDPDAGEDRAG